jgi:hypothetical protein
MLDPPSRLAGDEEPGEPLLFAGRVTDPETGTVDNEQVASKGSLAVVDHLSTDRGADRAPIDLDTG